MSQKSFKQHLKDEIEPIQLSDAQLQHLLILQEKSPNQKNTIRSKNKPLLVRYKSFCIALVLLVFVVLGIFTNQQWQREQLLQSIAEEIALNHYKLKPLEVESQSFSELNAYFTKLDFSPTSSDLFQLGKNNLIGGRYCSIQGISAAQIRYQNSNGSYTTLYQTINMNGRFDAVPDVEKGQTPIETHARGYKIRIWREKGLLFATVNNESVNNASVKE